LERTRRERSGIINAHRGAPLNTTLEFIHATARVTLPNLFSITTALIAFATLYAVAFWATRAVEIWGLVDALLYLIPGFLLGFMSPRDSLTGGALLGLLTVPVVFCIAYAFGMASPWETSALINALISGVLWCCVGAFAGEMTARRQ
jgi:hypothetical protein